MIGPRPNRTGCAVLQLLARCPCAGGSFAEVDRPLCRAVGTAPRARAVLQLAGSPVGRSRADDPDADRRVLFRYPLRAAPLRRGPPQSGLQVVLPARARRRCPRSFHLLEEPAWPFPRERSAATRL